MNWQHMALGLILLLGLLALVAPFEIGVTLLMCAIGIYLSIILSS